MLEVVMASGVESQGPCLTLNIRGDELQFRKVGEAVLFIDLELPGKVAVGTAAL